MDIKKKETIKLWIAILILLIIISIVFIIIVKYQVNGETNMPFSLSKITVISTAEGQQNENLNNDSKWNLIVNQSNDIYFTISKNENYKKTAIIDSIELENFTVTKEPNKGMVNVYMPNSNDGRRFIYDNAFLVKERLTYNGAQETNEKNLEIGNQGGLISIRVSNDAIGNYFSNEDDEIKHDGTLISKVDAKLENITFSIDFDFNITINNIKYKANISLDLPYDNIIEKGITELDKTDMQDIVFKRI